jgi:hypothetical protein
MQDSVDAKEANTSGSAPPPPVIDPASFGFDTPATGITEERLFAEFFG